MRDLKRSTDFYVEILGFDLATSWPEGAYLRAGDAWLALVLDPFARGEASHEETHIAFTVSEADLERLSSSIRSARITEWRDNRSEGPSIYFLDPDGHKLELHVGSLASRLASLAHDSRKAASSDTMTLLSNQPSFGDRPLNRTDLAPNPLPQFRQWLAEVEHGGAADPYAMTLSTVDVDGHPAARTVVLKAIDERGLIFTSPYDGPKSRELDRLPHAALTFYWPSVGRQVRVLGDVEKLSSEESDRLFMVRPREAQLALHGPPQSAPIPDRSTLQQHIAEVGAEFAGGPIERPAWGGYLVRPKRVEFWQGRSDRLHDRFLYSRGPEGYWTLDRLAP